MKCPVCNGILEKRKTNYSYAGLDFGLFDADVCKKCGEVFFTEESSDKIDAKAKQLGVWGLSAHTRIGYSGNSLIIRVSKQIVSFMGLKKGEEVTVRPEGKKRLVVEAK